MTKEQQDQWVRKAPTLVAWTLIMAVGGFAATTLKEISKEISELNSLMRVVTLETKIAKVDIERLEKWKDDLSARVNRLEERCSNHHNSPAKN